MPGEILVALFRKTLLPEYPGGTLLDPGPPVRRIERDGIKTIKPDRPPGPTGRARPSPSARLSVWGWSPPPSPQVRTRLIFQLNSILFCRVCFCQFYQFNSNPHPEHLPRFAREWGEWGVPKFPGHPHLAGAGCATPAGLTPAVNVAPCHDRDLEPFGAIFCAKKRFGFVLRKMHHAMVPEEIAPPAPTGLVFHAWPKPMGGGRPKPIGGQEAQPDGCAGGRGRWVCGRPTPMAGRE